MQSVEYLLHSYQLVSLKFLFFHLPTSSHHDVKLPPAAIRFSVFTIWESPWTWKRARPLETWAQRQQAKPLSQREKQKAALPSRLPEGENTECLCLYSVSACLYHVSTSTYLLSHSKSREEKNKDYVWFLIKPNSKIIVNSIRSFID